MFHCLDCCFSYHYDSMNSLNIRSVEMYEEMIAGQETLLKATYLRPAVHNVRAVDYSGQGRWAV